MSRWIAYTAFVLLAHPVRTFAPERVAPNDNRRTAGTLSNGVLTIALEARDGVWQPEGDNSRTLSIAAFGEEGKPLSTPGPLIRVPVGTTVRATLRNRLDKPLVVLGFGRTRGVSDSIMVPVNAAVPVSFTATTPGTYYYVGRRAIDPFGLRPVEDGQLNGVIVVDAPNVKRDPAER